MILCEITENQNQNTFATTNEYMDTSSDNMDTLETNMSFFNTTTNNAMH